ncbi:MAG: alpha/beta hydrolase [Rhodospirillales bacterium]|nr:MAG: alpha/beta hydrolase [Rhodospirillales bacterium]
MSRVVRALSLVAAALAGLGSVGGCSPAVLLNAVIPSDGYNLHRGLEYGTDDRQRLDVYVPQGATADPRPVVVFFYGGSWKSGTRDLYRFVGEAFAAAGYVVVIPDYRVYPAVQFPAFVDDGAAAVHWVQERITGFGGDRSRLIVAGHSAGAHLGALLLLDPRYLERAGADRESLCGFVGLAGPYAFDPDRYRSTRPIFATAPDSRETMPVTFADTPAPPMLLLHGADDGTVRPVNSLTLAERRREADGEADYISYPDLGHIGIVLSLAAPFRGRDAVYTDTVQFIERTANACSGDVISEPRSSAG